MIMTAKMISVALINFIIMPANIISKSGENFVNSSPDFITPDLDVWTIITSKLKFMTKFVTVN